MPNAGTMPTAAASWPSRLPPASPRRTSTALEEVLETPAPDKDNDEEQHIVRLADGLSGFGADCCRVGVGTGANGRGLFALTDLAPDDIVCAIPEQLLLSSAGPRLTSSVSSNDVSSNENCLRLLLRRRLRQNNKQKSARDPSEEGTILLTLLLVFEKSVLQSESRLAEYFPTLPKTYGTLPCYWDDKTWEEFDRFFPGRRFKAAAVCRTLEELWREWFAGVDVGREEKVHVGTDRVGTGGLTTGVVPVAVGRTMVLDPHCCFVDVVESSGLFGRQLERERLANVTYEDVRHALATVWTRACTHIVVPSPGETAGARWRGGPGAALGQAIHSCLVPFGDLLNHDEDRSHLGVCGVDEKTGCFVFRAGFSVKKGEEVTICYGRKSAFDLLCNYGFAPVEPNSSSYADVLSGEYFETGEALREVLAERWWRLQCRNWSVLQFPVYVPPR